MDLYIKILRTLERLEDIGDKMKYRTKEECQAAINRIAGKDFYENKKIEYNKF